MSVTVCQVIIKYRKKYHLSLEQVSQKISISKELLRFIESGEYQSYPIASEVEDALKRLCYIFHLDYQQINGMYRAEAQKSVTGKLPHMWKKSFKHLSITNQILRYGLIASLVGGIGGYILFQGILFIQNPRIQLDSPDRDFQYTTENVEVISGQVSPGAQVFLNGQSVELDSEGRFEVTVGLSPQENAIELQAMRDDSQVSRKQFIVYRR